MTYKNLKFQVWDLGGQTSIRPYWRCYYSNTDAVIYVVDSADRDRIGISKQELVSMLEVSYISCQKRNLLWWNESRVFMCFLYDEFVMGKCLKKSWNFVYIQATHSRSPSIVTIFFHKKIATKADDISELFCRVTIAHVFYSEIRQFEGRSALLS